MKKHFVGIDISKNTLDYVVRSTQSTETEKAKQIDNNLSGMEKMLRSFEKKGVDLHDCWFCFEHTGVYGLLLCSFLQSKGLTYTAESALQIKRSGGITRGKDDQVDAFRIADYAYTCKDKLKASKLPSRLLLKVKQMLTHRIGLVKTRTRVKNQLKAIKKAEKVTGGSVLRQCAEEHLKLLNTQIKRIEKEITSLLESDESVKKHFHLAKSVVGIGLVNSANMIVATNNFSHFPDARKYNCYAGIAPFSERSGTSIDKPARVSHLGYKTLKIQLYNAANSAIQHDPELRHYYQRKKTENKHHRSIINAVACKLVGRVFATVKRGTPYVVMYKEKVA